MAIRQLNLADLAVVICGLAIVLAIEVTKPAYRPLPDPHEALLRWSEQAEGAAVFARGARDAYGWTDNHNGLATARVDALARCAVAGGTTCKIIAERNESVRHPVLGVPASPNVARGFAKYAAGRGPKAFAMTQAGVFGYSTGRASGAVARHEAIAWCQKYEVAQAAEIPERACVIVHAVE